MVAMRILAAHAVKFQPMPLNVFWQRLCNRDLFKMGELEDLRPKGFALQKPLW